MIYFSDLDRTLIYSSRFLKDNNNEICIEYLDGKEINYISEKTVKLIKKLLEKVVLIPTTTRSREQFERIEFHKLGIDFDYSIVCNGGIILHHGKPLKEYDDYLKDKIKSCGNINSLYEEFKEKFEKYNEITKIRRVDDFFFYIVVDEDKFKDEILTDFIKKLEMENWNSFRSGRKIYFMPKDLNKESAIKFLKKYLNEDSIAALGDSKMDLNMLLLADKAYVPGNSYIKDLKELEDMTVSEYEGFKGTEDILKNILKDCN